ncbi:hypothetical protein [Cellulosimicrobium cellulans]|uniref:Uncharacterized protein n=1 Tax=Cellulosimicrobium cellulans TaxID=1710 RepID=A0A4Y4E6D8_CELCE|nr:hypothetical protein [Cellulosimicrobium cellulans]GED11514.1 hypothetical protein CCE02nite_35130 [Cellulosimicrobium cellulans]
MADDLTRPTVEGPALADVVHRLADTPPDVLDHPVVVAAALVGDTADLLAGDGAVGVLRGPQRAAVEALCTHAPYAALAGTVCWLVRDEHLRAAPAFRAAATPGALVRVVEQAVPALALLRTPDDWLHAPAAREELARAVLRELGLRPAGESPEVAQDRWAAVSTAEQRRIAREMAQEARRAEQLARELAEKRAKEAAAQYANY